MASEGAGQPPGQGSGQQVFVRRSSGLTRQVSALDALAYCAMNPGLLYAFIYAVWIIPLFASYGGANLPLAVLPVILMFPVAGLYWLYSVTMPRSGGEYVYISRTLHPALGLFACWMLSVTALSWFGLLTDWWLKWALADSFIATGVHDNSTRLINVGIWFEGQWQRTLIGSAAMLLMLWIYFKGAKLMMRLSYVAVLFSWIAVLVMGIAVLATGKASFVQSFQSLTGVKVSQIVGYGATTNVLTFTFMATLLGGATYVILNTLGSTFSANLAGEIRGVQRSQAIALFGALIIQMITWAFAYLEVYALAGHRFWHGLTMAYWNGKAFYPFGGSAAHHAAALSAGPLGASREPFPTLELAFVKGGAIVIFIFALGFLVSTFLSAGGLGFAPIRNVFAWSFDRLLPTKFAELDRRYRAPWLALVSVTIVGWLFLVIDIWKPAWTAYISFTIVGWMIGWLVLGVAGMVFPLTRPHLYRAAPPIVQRGASAIPTVLVLTALTIGGTIGIAYGTHTRTWGEIVLTAGVGAIGVVALWYVGRAQNGVVPYISMLGWATFAVAAFIEWSILRPFFSIGGQPAAAHWSAMKPIPFMMAAPIVIYLIAAYSARRRQIPLGLQFAEVPPE